MEKYIKSTGCKLPENFLAIYYFYFNEAKPFFKLAEETIHRAIIYLSLLIFHKGNLEIALGKEIPNIALGGSSLLLSCKMGEFNERIPYHNDLLKLMRDSIEFKDSLEEVNWFTSKN